MAEVKQHDLTDCATFPLSPCSFFEKTIISIAKYIDKIGGGGRKDFETTLKRQQMIQNTRPDSKERIISLAMKSLYTNIPLVELPDITVEKLYSPNESTYLPRSTMKRFLLMVVSLLFNSTQ